MLVIVHPTLNGRLGLRAFSVAALAAVALACSAGPIYKCRNAAGDITYTDIACRDGEEIAVRAGEADAHAIERLAQQQQAASERFARERAAAAFEARQLRIAESQQAAAPVPSPDVAPACDYCGAPLGYGYFAPAEPPRRHPRRFPRGVTTFVPAR